MIWTGVVWFGVSGDRRKKIRRLIGSGGWERELVKKGVLNDENLKMRLVLMRKKL